MSLGFKIYSFLNGNLVHKDSLGNKFYNDKKNTSKRWVVYANDLGRESLPTNYHNWLDNTSESIIESNSSENDLMDNIKRRTQKHISTHKDKLNKGYNSWQPK
jgi:NADH:ubiquinone oxidoreductase subunit